MQTLLLNPKRLFTVIIISLLSLFAVSCARDDSESVAIPSLAVETTTLYFDMDGNPADEYSGRISITSNRDWSATATSDGDWLTISPTSGSGNGVINMVMPASEVTRTATVYIEISNAYGVLSDRTVMIVQSGADSNTSTNIIFDGSELSTTYPSDETISVGGAEFVVNRVANFSSLYQATGPIQFGSDRSYIYNTTAIEDINSVVIALSNSYDNFTLFAGSEANPDGEAISGSNVDNVVTYIPPEGSTYIAIRNSTSYTAYANTIELVIGDNISTTGGSGSAEESGDVVTTDTSQNEQGDGSYGGVITTAEFRKETLISNTYTLENVRVDFASGSYAYVSADGVSVNLYSSEEDLVVGNNVTITGEAAEYGGVLQLTNLTAVSVNSTDTAAQIIATEHTVQSLVAATADRSIIAQYIKLDGVALTASDISEDGSTIAAYYRFVEYPNSHSSYTLYGYMGYYNGTYQLMPTEITGEGAEIEEPYDGVGTAIIIGDYFPISDDLSSVNLTESYDIADNFTFDFSASTGSTKPRLWYANGWQLRTYGGSSTSVMTISTKDGANITSIIFTANENDSFTVDVGAYSGATWTGSANSITFTGIANTQITSMQIITE